MPINASYEYANALKEYEKAHTDEERLLCLKGMLSTAPNHKGTESLRADIKTKIAECCRIRLHCFLCRRESAVPSY